MSPPATGTKSRSESSTARLLGSGTSGLLELLLFHPVDTVAKRLMTHHQPIYSPGEGLAGMARNLNEVVFKKEASNPSVVRRYLSLFPGLGFAAGYKILQVRPSLCECHMK